MTWLFPITKALETYSNGSFFHHRRRDKVSFFWKIQLNSEHYFSFDCFSDESFSYQLKQSRKGEIYPFLDDSTTILSLDPKHYIELWWCPMQAFGGGSCSLHLLKAQVGSACRVPPASATIFYFQLFSAVSSQCACWPLAASSAFWVLGSQSTDILKVNKSMCRICIKQATLELCHLL